MPPNIQDRRVQRTRQLLRTALIELVQKQGYYSISIQDLTNYANLGKATFYLHYKDKDELLYECMDFVLKELTDRIKALPHTRWSASDHTPLRIAFEFAAENARFITIMMNDQGGLKFFQRLHKIVVDLLMETMKSDVHTFGAQPMVPLEFLSNYFAGSMEATIEWWVGNQMKYSIDEMVEMVSKADSLPRNEIMGVKA
jgi:AcrR family transcriptional regulator